MPAVRTDTPTKLYQVIREQGRNYQWLASQSGYTAQYIGAVARGERRPTRAFYVLMRAILGVDVTDAEA